MAPSKSKQRLQAASCDCIQSLWDSLSPDERREGLTFNDEKLVCRIVESLQHLQRQHDACVEAGFRLKAADADPFKNSVLLSDILSIKVQPSHGSVSMLLEIKEAFLQRDDIFPELKQVLPDFLQSQSGCRRYPLPKAAWKNLWDMLPKSFEALEQQLAKTLEQAFWAMATEADRKPVAKPKQEDVTAGALVEEDWMIESKPSAGKKSKKKKSSKNKASSCKHDGDEKRDEDKPDEGDSVDHVSSSESRSENQEQLTSIESGSNDSTIKTQSTESACAELDASVVADGWQAVPCKQDSATKRRARSSLKKNFSSFSTCSTVSDTEHDCGGNLSSEAGGSESDKEQEVHEINVVSIEQGCAPESNDEADNKKAPAAHGAALLDSAASLPESAENGDSLLLGSHAVCSTEPCTLQVCGLGGKPYKEASVDQHPDEPSIVLASVDESSPAYIKRFGPLSSSNDAVQFVEPPPGLGGFGPPGLPLGLPPCPGPILPPELLMPPLMPPPAGLFMPPELCCPSGLPLPSGALGAPITEAPAGLQAPQRFCGWCGSLRANLDQSFCTSCGGKFGA